MRFGGIHGSPDPRFQAKSTWSRSSVRPHTGFEPVSAETEVPEPLRRKLDELRAQSKKKADERH
jgi:hypothetical protein